MLIALSAKYSQLSSKSPLYHTVFYTLAATVILSYLYTGVCDAGVITPNEDNAIENADQLEKQSYTYCTICKLFRPPKAAHCSRCGVCFRNMDHHCAYMGWMPTKNVICSQCVARNNKVSFYVFLILLFVLEVMLIDIKPFFLIVKYWPFELMYKVFSPIFKKLYFCLWEVHFILLWRANVFNSSHMK